MAGKEDTVRPRNRKHCCGERTNGDSVLLKIMSAISAIESPPLVSTVSLLLLCIALPIFSCSASQRAPTPRHGSSFTSPYLNLYHSSNELISKVKALEHRHPDKLKVSILKDSSEGYRAEVTVVTYRSDDRETDKSKFRVLLSFGQHGRELITSELALHILSILSEEIPLLNIDRSSFLHTLRNSVIKVVPIENVNGRKLVEAGKFCERRNGRGVDLNRNWDLDWGKKEKDYDPHEENPGAFPFSEPETKIMKNLSSSFHPHVWINVHSGMEALFMPYDHKNMTPEGSASLAMRSLLEKLNRLHFHGSCMVGSGGGSVGYLAHGTATDYMYEVVKVPMAFTFEIYGDSAASSKQCFKLFNPSDQNTFNRVLLDWSGLLFTLLFETGSMMSVPMTGDPVVYSAEGFEKNLESGSGDGRVYFCIFFISIGLLMCVFLSRIPKNKLHRGILV